MQNKKFSLTCLGGGAETFRFLSEGGWSKNFIFGNIPYNQLILEQQYGKFEKIVDKETTCQIAHKDYNRLKALFPTDSCVSIVTNCALQKVFEEREGRKNLAYIAYKDDKQIIFIAIDFSVNPNISSKKNRFSQEGFVQNILMYILDTIYLGGELMLDSLNTRLISMSSAYQATILVEANQIDSHLLKLWEKENYFYYSNGDLPNNAIIFSGSFNPFHDGHLEVAKTLSQKLSKKIILELSTKNARKSEISFRELLVREHALKEICIKHSDVFQGYILSNIALFEEKINAYSNFQSKQIDFVMGFDTLKRFSDDYILEVTNRTHCLEQLWFTLEVLSNKPTFHVFHRNTSEQDIQKIDKTILNHTRFYSHNKPELMNLSSTKIRAETK